MKKKKFRKNNRKLTIQKFKSIRKTGLTRKAISCLKNKLKKTYREGKKIKKKSHNTIKNLS